MKKQIGIDIGVTTRWGILQQLHRPGIRLITDAKVISLQGGDVETVRENSTERIHADIIVLAAGSQSHNPLADDLRGRVPELYIIGDAVKPRKALEAIKEGFYAGNKI